MWIVAIRIEKVNTRERYGRNGKRLSSRVYTHFEGLASCIK